MTELKDTLNAHWKQNKSGFGYRMLMKMGWSDEKGLGKNEDGIVNSVKLKKRDEGLGLGMEAVTDDQVGSKSWNQTVSGFNAVLDMLKNSKYGSSTSSSSDSDNDSEGKKKKSKKEKKSGKEKKKESKKEKKESKPRPIISVGIKYKKFRDAKTLVGKSTADKQAIFGHAVTLNSTPEPSAASDVVETKKESKKDKKKRKRDE